MCGICGFNWDDKSLLKKMNALIAHRGPDGEGLFTDNTVSLGHRRLSIIDLDPRGVNPIYNEDGSICVIYNGEIYNYQELKGELEKKGHVFSTETDTEVIVHLYEEYGVDFLSKLNGMFAFCLYDMNRNKLFLARDRMGIKPLYYVHVNNQFIFSSEIKSFMVHDFKKQISLPAFQTFMTMRFTLNQSMIKGIEKVPPAHYLVYDLKKHVLDIKSYWDISFTKSTPYNPQKLLSLLDDSVKKRLQADVPVGVFLSGGLDSSIITGLAASHHKNINTFSVGFESTTNELPHAHTVSQHFQTNHKEIKIGDKHIEALDEVVYHMDEPINDAAFLPVYFLNKFAKKTATVVLAGEGSDEIFTGYDRYKLLHYANKFSKFIPDISTRNVILQRVLDIKKASSPRNKHIQGIRQFSQEELKQLNVKEKLPGFKLKGNTLLDKAQYFDIKTLLPNDFLMKADKMGSAFAVEARVPFLDHRIVQHGINLPLNKRLRGWNEKFALKKAAKDLLPKQTIQRRKHGFNTPADAWFKGVLKAKLSSLLDESSHKFYNQSHVQKLLKQFQSSSTNHKSNFFTYQKLWGILIFEMWYQQQEKHFE